MMKPSPTLIPRLTPLLRHSTAAYPPVIVHTTSLAAVSHPVECSPWWIAHSIHPTPTSHPSHTTALLTHPAPTQLQTQPQLRRTQAPGESHVPPPTIAWCDYLSMV
ncbi:hypothetical protein IAT38_004176 [Cryptococcus sp. DSM 104549]